MTRDDILRIAKEAGVWVAGQKPYQTQLERFADRILEHLRWDGIHTCNDECQRPACVAVKAEREACAQLVDNYALQYDEPVWAIKLTEAIRARSEK
jgi:hypothetical protein